MESCTSIIQYYYNKITIKQCVTVDSIAVGNKIRALVKIIVSINNYYGKEITVVVD